MFFCKGKKQEKENISMFTPCLVNCWHGKNQFVSGSGTQPWETSNHLDMQPAQQFFSSSKLKQNIDGKKPRTFKSDAFL